MLRLPLYHLPRATTSPCDVLPLPLRLVETDILLPAMCINGCTDPASNETCAAGCDSAVGVVTEVTVKNAGFGYSTAPNITWLGDCKCERTEDDGRHPSAAT